MCTGGLWSRSSRSTLLRNRAMAGERPPCMATPPRIRTPPSSAQKGHEPWQSTSPSRGLRSGRSLRASCWPSRRSAGSRLGPLLRIVRGSSTCRSWYRPSTPAHGQRFHDFSSMPRSASDRSARITATSSSSTATPARSSTSRRTRSRPRIPGSRTPVPSAAPIRTLSPPGSSAARRASSTAGTWSRPHHPAIAP